MTTATKLVTRSELVAEGVCSLDEAARLLDVNVRSLYSYMHKGQLPWVKVGGLRKIPKVALRRFLEANLHCDDAVLG